MAACADAPSQAAVVALDSALSTVVANQGRAEVIIQLVEPVGPFESRASRHVAIDRAQSAVLATLGEELTLVRRYRHVPALAGDITQGGIDRLAHDPRVSSIQLDGHGGGQLKQAVPAIGGDRAHELLKMTGKGVRVALLDTGVDTTHPDLRDAIVAQHCYTRAACPPRNTNESESGEDDHGHGSNVAGIVASRGVVSAPGFAPEAELVVVKVNDRNDRGQQSEWVAGLDWIYDNLTTNHVSIINLSIGTDALYPGNCDSAEPTLRSAIANLIDAGVTVFAASGNRGSSSMLGAPACISGVIAVGATYDADVGHQPPNTLSYSARWGSSFANCADDTTAFDQVACFTNSNDRLDIVAPGAPILSDTLRGGTELYYGTSQAAPVAAGVAAMMLQCQPSLGPQQVKELMRQTGVMRVDPKNGKSFPSLRAFEAVSAACSMAMAGGGAAAGSGSAGVAAPADVPAATTTGVDTAGIPAAVSPVAGSPSSPAVAGTTSHTGSSMGAAISGTGASAPMVQAATPQQTGCSCHVSARSHRHSFAPAWFSFALAALGWRRRTRRELRGL